MKRRCAVDVIAQRISHSCVVGLRARLKPGRFWFDSRGWDCIAGLVAKWLCTGFLNRVTWVRFPPGPRRICERAPCADADPNQQVSQVSATGDRQAGEVLRRHTGAPHRNPRVQLPAPALTASTSLCVWIHGSGPGCSSQVPREHDESDAPLTAGLADRLGNGLPPRPGEFDSRGPHVLFSPL